MRWKATVLGPPVTMGSKRAFVNKKTMRAVVVDDNCTELRSWQQAMREQMAKDAPAEPVVGAVSVRVVVGLQRPKSHFGTGRNAGKLRNSAPPWPTGKPDVDKILRALLDCGTGIWWRDDAQVFWITVAKVWVNPGDDEPPRTTIYAALMSEKWDD